MFKELQVNCKEKQKKARKINTKLLKMSCRNVHFQIFLVLQGMQMLLFHYPYSEQQSKGFWG